MTTTTTTVTETDSIRYVVTHVDSISIWKIQNGEIELIAQDLAIVTHDDVHDDDMDLGDARVGDWVDIDTYEIFTLAGVDLDKIECLDGLDHSVESIQEHLDNE